MNQLVNTIVYDRPELKLLTGKLTIEQYIELIITLIIICVIANIVKRIAYNIFERAEEEKRHTRLTLKRRRWYHG